MSKVKYRVREFSPKANQGGTHSFFAEAVISTDIDATELARKIAARTGIKSYEAAMAIHAIADIVAEETLEGSRISLANEDGTKLVSIYPKVSGSISDAQVQAEPEKYGGAQVATEEMLTSFVPSSLASEIREPSSVSSATFRVPSTSGDGYNAGGIYALRLTPLPD